MSKALRTLLLALIVTLVASLALPIPAAHAATTQFKFSGRGAFASWFFEGERNVGVDIALLDGSLKNAGRPVAEKSLFLGVFQSFCDTDTNELVFINYFTFEPSPSATLSVSSRLTSAAVRGTLELLGFEDRIPNCEEPVWEEGTSSELGPANVDLAANWAGTGKIMRQSGHTHLISPECKFSSRFRTTFRSARATGSLTSDNPDLDLGSLGEAIFGELFSSSDMSVIIGDGCGDPEPVP